MNKVSREAMRTGIRTISPYNTYDFQISVNMNAQYKKKMNYRQIIIRFWKNRISSTFQWNKNTRVPQILILSSNV